MTPDERRQLLSIIETQQIAMHEFPEKNVFQISRRDLGVLATSAKRDHDRQGNTPNQEE